MMTIDNTEQENLQVNRAIKKEETINQINNYISKQNWFVDWSPNIELDMLLVKKELRTPY
jgi:hypothetical protein